MFQPDDDKDSTDSTNRPPVVMTHADVESNTKILFRLGWIAWGLECSLKISIPYYKSVTFGLSTLLAFIPQNPFISASDIVNLLALYIIIRAYFLKPALPFGIYVKMLFNLFLGLVFSRIWFIGGMLMGWWKPNRRNVALLEEYVPYIDYDSQAEVNNGAKSSKKKIN
eukprot:TRINITY_DN9933_c0_g1_i3.p1 TRINITY_DN9933_c0_g1~~TRINITY_DN9933_c0_g1_i3.p1  ORF type:complete len:168 (-),score=46.49 TRINITY_DN9933_c0_g1_i3:818-1321(-)